MLEQWVVFLYIMLWHLEEHSVIYYINLLIDAVDEVNSCLQVQLRYRPEFLAAMVWLIQTDFDETLHQVFTSADKIREDRKSVVDLICR